MNLSPEHQKELETFPAALRALIDAELAAGNGIQEIGHSHPAPPAGAFVKFTRKVTTRARASGGGLKFYERNTSLYSGEFYDDKRFYFVLEPANPPPLPPDMDAIRKAHEPKPDPIVKLAERVAGSQLGASVEQVLSTSRAAPKGTTPPGIGTPSLTNMESPTGWTRVLHFRDKRPPHLVQFALERELMVLFQAGMDGSELRMSATAHLDGARYDFELRFVAALSRENCFSLRTEVSWADSNPTHHDYLRKSSDSWFGMWIRELHVSNPPDPKDNQAERYRSECEATLHPTPVLDSVPAVQRAIVEAMKRGGTYGTSHKEGGSNLFWRGKHFIRSDYGDYPDTKIYKDDEEFLKALWQFCQFEVTRHAGKQGLSELDAWKLILRRMRDMPPSPDEFRGSLGGVLMATLPPKMASATLTALGTSTITKWISLGVLVLIFVGLAGWRFVSIESTGTPLGAALRSETHLFQLINTQERYMPSLHRNPSKNRYRIDLLVIPLVDPTREETFTLIRQQQSHALTPMTKILGVDGDVVWIQALDTFAVNLRTKRVVRQADLKKANPELDLFLNTARSEFKDRFVAVSPDWSQAYEFSGETLKASMCQPPPRDGWIEEQSSGRIERSLCSGGVIGSNEWIAVASPDDAKADFKVGFSLSRDFIAGEKDHKRQLYRGTADYGEKRPPIQGFARLTETEYRAASFLRSHPGGPIHRSTNPDGFFLIHRAGTELFAPYTLVRLAPDGKELWHAATGLGRLEQVLPGQDTIVLKGERTPVPNKVPEPILVVVASSSGEAKTASLWR